MLTIGNVVAPLKAADARRAKVQKLRPARRQAARYPDGCQSQKKKPINVDVEVERPRPRGGGRLAARLLASAAAAAAAGIVVAASAAGPALAVGPVSIPFDDVTYEEIECARHDEQRWGKHTNQKW